MRKPYRFPHYGKVENPRSFAKAYQEIATTRSRIYLSRTRTPFVPISTRAKFGRHKGERVIIFKTKNGKEVARSYACCWGHITNCNRTYIDRYSMSI